MRANRQRDLPFDSKREQARLARVERLLSDIPKVKRVARLFDEQAAREAAEVACGAVASGWVDSAR